MTASSGSAPDAGSKAPLRVAVFDVLGTVVDERGSFRSAVRSTGASPDPTAPIVFADRWLDMVSNDVRSIASRTAPWRPWDEVVADALVRQTPRIDDPLRTELSLVGHRLRAWPDSRAGLEALQNHLDVIALSNAGITPLMDTSRVNGLRWSAVFSSEIIHSAKPDPRVYRFLLDLLRIEPEAVVMVAAHPWDLRAAAEQGMRTAYVSRPGEGKPDEGDRFTWYAEDLIDLARQLTE